MLGSVVLAAGFGLLAAGAAAQTATDCGVVTGPQLAALFTTALQVGSSRSFSLNNCTFEIAGGPAAPAASPSVPTAAPAAPVPVNANAKRGIGTWNPTSDLTALKGADWWYSWGIDPGADAIAAGNSAGIEFVSMIVRPRPRLPAQSALSLGTSLSITCKQLASVSARSAQWGKDSSGGIGPPNAGMAQLGNIPAGTKVLLGFNEPNHVRRKGLSGPALGAAQPAGLSFKVRPPLPPRG